MVLYIFENKAKKKKKKKKCIVNIQLIAFVCWDCYDRILDSSGD